MMLSLSLFATIITAPNTPTYYHSLPLAIKNTDVPVKKIAATYSVPDVPFYSQFKDVKSPTWQKQACGVVSLAMLIDYYKPDTMSVEKLLAEGITAGAYNEASGWTYKGLIQLGEKYGLSGNSYDLSKQSSEIAFQEFKKYLSDGPAIVSIHYKFDPKSTIPHLIVINGIKDDIIYYNDPAAKTGEKKISVAGFLKGWKKRFIVMRPTVTNKEVAFEI